MDNENGSHLEGVVRDGDRDRYILSLYVSAHAHDALIALYALNVELKQIADKVSEEMIGLVRLAWWQEALDDLFAGKVRPHPVLQALAPLVEEGHLSQIVVAPIIESYQQHFPLVPPNMERLLETASLTLLRSLDEKAQSRWQKKHAIIRAHRMRYGEGQRNGWLYLKLLLS